MDPDTYLSERVDGQLAWLGSQSRMNKSAFMRNRLISILLGALITILSPYAGQEGPMKTWIPTALQLAGAGVAITGALLALHRHQENWLRYRTLKEALEREKMLYLTGSLPAYTGPEAFHQFVRRVEELMAEERVSWGRQASDQASLAQPSGSLPHGGPAGSGVPPEGAPPEDPPLGGPPPSASES
ncbi:MAG: DUF4231 domain-containing protein [Cyanobacteriota bacterium]